jgi:hypothetical protein
MKRLVLILAVSALCSSPALAQDKKKALTPQQQKMAECSSKAKGLKGDEYKKARDTCLKGDSATTVSDKKLSPQQQKMADCSTKAKGLKGDDFKKARNDCLKG